MNDYDINQVAQAIAKAIGYYVPFHAGLSSPSADRLRKIAKEAIEKATR